MWRNMAVWSLGADVDLPGPAEWWVDGYDYRGFGFDVPEFDDGHNAAFELLFEAQAPPQYDLVFPSHDDLRVMKDTPEAQMIQQWMA